MNTLQKFVLGVTACFLALRVFFPVQYVSRSGPTTNLSTTLLHMVGILVVATAAFMLAPSLRLRRRMGSRRRRFETALHRTMVAGAVVIAVAIGAVFGFRKWQYDIAQSRHRVVEGRSVGNIALGMSLQDVQRRLGPFSSASLEPRNVTRYFWNGIEGYWSVFFDAATKRAVAIIYYPRWSDDKSATETEERLALATTRGARYHHDPATIQALYGDKPKVYKFPKMEYFYPNVRTEFEFVCGYEPESGEECMSYKLDEITIYAEGWSPERLWGSDYGQEKQ